MRLEAENLVCVRGGRTVFSGIGFRVGEGGALLITGANGAGKSSLLRMIAGLVSVAGGTLRLQNGDPERTLHEQAHYLGHQDALKPSLTVAENLSFWMRYFGAGPSASARTGQAHGKQADAERAHTQEALAMVGLAALADLPAAYLSAGQRRRLSLARLVAAPRPIWLLDEPTNALDSAAQAMLAALMAEHRAGGGMILAATHGPIGLADSAGLRLGPDIPEPPA